MQRSDRLHGVRAMNRSGAGLREPEVLDLAFSNEVLHCAGHLLDRHVGVDPVLVKEIDPIGPEAPKRGFCDRPDMLGAAAQAAPFAGGRVDVEAELRCNRHPVAKRRQGLADQFLVGEGPIDLRGVEEIHPAFDGRPDQGYSRPLVDRRTIGVAQTHAAEPHGRDFEPALSKFAHLHDG